MMIVLPAAMLNVPPLTVSVGQSLTQTLPLIVRLPFVVSHAPVQSVNPGGGDAAARSDTCCVGSSVVAQSGCTVVETLRQWYTRSAGVRVMRSLRAASWPT